MSRDVLLGKELRTGAATENGEEVVLGTVFMLMGENSRTVSQRVAAKLEEVNRSLPEGVVAKTVYDRTTLVERTIRTVASNLFEGALLVVAVLFAFLGNLRAALITAAVIPLSMLFTVTGMVENRVSAQPDEPRRARFRTDRRRRGDHRRELHPPARRSSSIASAALLERGERFQTVFEATREVVKPSLVSVHRRRAREPPDLHAHRVEGKMFHPMAFTVVVALARRADPVGDVRARGGRALRYAAASRSARTASCAFGRAALPAGARCRDAQPPRLAIAAAAVLVALSGLARHAHGQPSSCRASTKATSRCTRCASPAPASPRRSRCRRRSRQRIMAFPEVERVFAKIGTAEIATDPMPPNVADNFVMLKPRSEWPDPNRPKAELVAAMQAAVEQVPGNNYEFTQPIQMRFNELISGVRSDVAVKVFGDDLETLVEVGERIAAVLERVPGAADVKVEQASGLPVLTVQLDRPKISRYGLNVSDVQDVVEVAVGGKEAGQVFEGDRRFDLVVRLPESQRTDLARARSGCPSRCPPQARGRTARG